MRGTDPSAELPCEEVVILNTSTIHSSSGIPSRYIALLTPVLAFAWFLPNHQLPWTSFHADAWSGFIFCIVALWVFIRTPDKVALPNISLIFIATACIPWLQYLSGEIYSGGNAWIQSIYILGFATSIILGRQWQIDKAEQPLNFLFSAFIFGSLVSVAIEFLQIFQYSSIWVVQFAGGRAHANINQPNQLATLLLLGTIGTIWHFQKKQIPPAAAFLSAFILLTGLSFTLSRTGWINLALISITLIVTPPTKPSTTWRLTIIGLAFYFFIATLIAPEIISTHSGNPSAARAFSDPFRIAIWRGSIEAIEIKPWLGWGWGQTYTALMDGNFASSIKITKHSHNIILDFLLYNGIPVGLTILAIFFASVVRNIPLLRNANRQSPILAIVVLLVHSMFELPLHYAYFLLPFGLIIGALSADTCRVSLPKPTIIFLPLALLTGLWVTSNDYFQIERDFGQIGYINNYANPYTPKPLSVLTQWEDRQWFANTRPTPIQSEDELRRIENVVFSAPQSIMEVKLAHHLILSNQFERASLWLNHMCQSGDPKVVVALLEHWDNLGKLDPKFLKVVKPKCDQIVSQHTINQTMPTPPSIAPTPMNHSG